MDTKELKNTYKIIQNKLASCQNEKRNIVLKKTTKRTLLQESQHVLQNHLVNALTENLKKKKKISMDKNQENLKSIISSSSSITTNIENDSRESSPVNQQPINEFDMIKCHGWIMDRRVWIQVQSHALNTTETHIRCLPNKFIPETTCLNKCNNDEYQHLFLCFDLLPDIQINEIQSELRIYCNYKQGSQIYSSKTCLIEWFDEKNLMWFDLLSISSSQIVLQAYFPYYISVKNLQKITDSYQLNQLIKHSQPLNQEFLFIQNQFTLMKIDAKLINIYALSSTSISFILNILNNIELTSISKEISRDFIVSTSEYYVSPNYKTRAKVSLITSQLFAI
ncbi:hypothetical protein INT46_004068 [Mucor plumbeus]|uniref:Uncharacterized protein n=1 Tax=Mucor plumbeus TaxID=97098 RepID=A0A8H7QWH4_9FUNG|nr:hypothetical protein INT46_004068 [Mucor plumbeus]